MRRYLLGVAASALALVGLAGTPSPAKADHDHHHHHTWHSDHHARYHGWWGPRGYYVPYSTYYYTPKPVYVVPYSTPYYGTIYPNYGLSYPVPYISSWIGP